MLKKAGIVVAAAAVGLLATGSLAFAQETNTNTEDNLTTTCNFNQSQEVTSTDAGGNGIISLLNPALDVIIPVAAQLPILSCNTVGVTDTADFNSENDIESNEETKIKKSFNDLD